MNQSLASHSCLGVWTCGGGAWGGAHLCLSLLLLQRVQREAAKSQHTPHPFFIWVHTGLHYTIIIFFSYKVYNEFGYH